MKKILALVLALTMILMIGAVFADDIPSLTQDPKNNLSLDGTITVGGLENGDTVRYYQVVKWDNGWKLGDEFANMTDPSLSTIVGDKNTAGRITAANAIKISQVAGITGVDGGTVNGSTWVASGVDAGLYMVIITPATQGVVYNPVFVAADYYTNSTNEITLSNNGNDYHDSAMAKKTKVTLEKEASTITTTDVGGLVDFDVTTLIPLYGSAYVDPVFTLTDTMSTGLKVKKNTISIKYKSGENYVDFPADAYELTAGTAEDEFVGAYTVKWNSDYLKAMTAALNVKITYKAKITGEVEQSVNPEENTVELIYSNNPTDTTGGNKLIDKTEHYTFDIDGLMYGKNEYHNTEVVKVGLDKDGNEITQTIELSNGHWVGALEGAKFKLYKADGKTEYTNEQIPSGTVFESGPDGRINIKGLAEGEYVLKETSAPAGYIASDANYNIKITTKTSKKTFVEDGITYQVETLDSYKVFINNVETASYTLTYEADENNVTDPMIDGSSEGDTVVGGNDSEEGKPSTDRSGKIVNTQGVSLPSTGGIGTTIFYILGGLLVVGAAVILVARRKAQD